MEDKKNWFLYSNTAIVLPPVQVTTKASVLLVKANPARKGLLIYNSGTNPLCLAFALEANVDKTCTTWIAAGITWQMTPAVYMGPISAIRTTGDAKVFVTELT